MDYALTTHALCKQYGSFQALDGLTMRVPKGAIYGFVGKNGVGKTTLIRLVCGLQRPSAGEFFISGVRHTDSAIAEARKKLGAVVESPSMFPDLSAEENLRYQYRLLGLPDEDGIPELLQLVGLEQLGKKQAKDFSLGMRQRLGLAIALCGKRDFLILDEPINGLDPQGILDFRELIQHLNRERGITFLISSHILDELARLATHYGFIDRGRTVRELSARELEDACRKSIRVRVTDTAALPPVLDGMGLSYQITDRTGAEIYGRPEISALVFALAERNCRLLSCTEQEESLESFFFSLVGGGDRA
ncbi:MAG: ATP-binding cassette domain-containing protein [Oscillospiraceae bacterium]|nr:ATP-binding cassette domain-containing protein [Oscillospiraceae bacterium]